MIDATLLFLLRDDEILLAEKKTGMGAGNYNGAGGKVEPEDASILEAAIRETQEELLVQVERESVQYIGEIEFTFPHNPGWNMRVHCYFATRWNGEPQETRELRPKWWKLGDIPYDKMWDDDKYWLPLALQGEFIKAYFTFDEGSKVENVEFDLPEGHLAKPLN